MCRYLSFTVLVLLVGVLATDVVSGRILWYVQERSVWLVALSVPVLGVMAAAQLRRPRDGSRSWPTALVVALPLVAAAVVPSRPLGSAAMASQFSVPAPAVSASLGVSVDSLTLDQGTRTWDMRQLSRLQLQDPWMQGLEGQRASLLGFVYRTTTLPADEILVGRFVIRCCTADAVGVAIPVRTDRASQLVADTWVQVDGTIHYDGSPGGSQLVVDAEKLDVVSQPDRPYIYP